MKQLTAQYRVPIEMTQRPDWAVQRADIVNKLVSDLWSSGYKLAGDVEIEETTIRDHHGVALWHEFNATCQGREHDF